MEYFYVHVISYWPGNNRYSNIHKHIEFFKYYTLNNKQYTKPNLLIVNIRSDNMQPIIEIEDIIKLYNKYSQFKIHSLYSYNSGGTVKSLYDIYKYLENKNIKYDYIACCEDDYCFKTFKFLDYAIEYLNKDYIFVGSLWDATEKEIKNGIKLLDPPDPYRVVPYLHHRHIYINTKTPNEALPETDYKWVEDPYITTYKNLKLIETKLHKFTLAPENEPYNYWSHGINYGEIGFPSRLAINNFKFIGIQKEKLLQDLDTRKKKTANGDIVPFLFGEKL